jgi:monofunctional biosynthetic peptidoglycan transglycosylase
VAAGGGFWRRLRNALLWVLALFLVASVLAVLLLRWIPPPTTAFILNGYGSAWLARDFRWHADYRWTPYGRISPDVKLAVIASEDQKFAFHPGFDFEAIDEAIRARERGKRLRGASTISQQVAKNLFLWPTPSFVRKGFEAYFTLLIEWLWPKQRILEVYLNVAEFGPGIYGIGAAAPRFFNTDAAHVDQPEAAMLAVALPNPRRLRVDHPGDYMVRRQAWVIEQMDELGGSAYIHRVERAVR